MEDSMIKTGMLQNKRIIIESHFGKKIYDVQEN